MKIQSEIFFIIEGKEKAESELTQAQKREIKITLKERFMRECGYEKVENIVEKLDK